MRAQAEWPITQRLQPIHSMHGAAHHKSCMPCMAKARTWRRVVDQVAQRVGVPPLQCPQVPRCRACQQRPGLLVLLLAA